MAGVTGGAKQAMIRPEWASAWRFTLSEPNRQGRGRGFALSPIQRLRGSPDIVAARHHEVLPLVGSYPGYCDIASSCIVRKHMLVFARSICSGLLTCNIRLTTCFLGRSGTVAAVGGRALPREPIMRR